MADGSDTKKNVVPDLPTALSRVTGWWKVGEVFSYLAFAASFLLSLLGNWLPPFFLDRYVWLVIALVVLPFAFFIRFVRDVSPLTTEAIQLIREKNIFTTESKERIAARLELLERRVKRLVMALVAVGLLLTLAVAGEPFVHRLRTSTPRELIFDDIRYFQPSRDQARYQAWSFLNALRSQLTSEIGESDRAKIVVFEIKPFSHPTPRFNITLDSEKDRFNLVGFAFRLQSGQPGTLYEPMPVNSAVDGDMILHVPASESGDRIIGIMRLKMRGRETDFPGDLTREIRIQVNSKEDK